MIHVLFLFLGLILGGAACHAFHMRRRRSAEAAVSLDGVRWEKAAGGLLPDAVRHLRRHYPTHELVAECPFLSLVTARGASCDAVRRQCAGWTAGVVMIDKRTGGVSRVILWSDCDDVAERTWILRRVGYKVTAMARDIGEAGLMEAMAA